MPSREPQRYWEDVKEGNEVPGYSIHIDWTTVVKQVSGSQDYNPVHHNPEFARSSGHRSIFVNTGFMEGCFSHMLTDFVGDNGWVCKFRMEMRRMNIPGDTISFKGKVVKKYINDQGEHLVDLEVWCENQREGVTTPSFATVILPSRSSVKRM